MMLRLLTVAAALASFQVGSAQCPAIDSQSGDSPTIKINLPGRESRAKSGTPLWVEVIMANPLDHDISFWKSTNKNSYPIEVSGETGKALPDKRPGFRHGRFDPALLNSKHLDPKLVDSGEIVRMLSGSLVCITLKPGESFVERVDVTKFFDMSAPGNYTIAMEEIGPSKAGVVKSSSVKVLVAKE
jgi:hypothetical protein